MTWLGIDLGTSSVKALLVDENQNIIASTNASLDVSRPHPGWSEQNPADWIAGTKKAIKALQQTCSAQLSSVKAIGLSGHMHGATLVNEEGNVLRPCMLWNDTRSHEQAARLDADEAFRKISGNIVFPGFTAPKVLWVKEHEPEIFGQTAKILLPKDYLRYWLTGTFYSEMSDAAGTSWLDVGNRTWSAELLNKSEVELEHMPELVEGTEPTGSLRKELASEFGIDGTPIVVGGGGDNAASAIGMGAVSSGDAFLSLGTSGVLFGVTGTYNPNAESAVHTFCHAVPNTWHQMGVMLSATDALNWLSGVTGKSAQALDEALPKVPDGPSGITFMPYLSGERTPHNDAQIRGGFIGLGHESDTVQLTKAVMEGVAFAFKDSLDAMASAGTEINTVTAVGGGAKSSYWLQLLADILQIKIDLPGEADFGAAFGAARLAMIGSEKADPESLCTKPAIERSIEPDVSQAERYSEALSKYRDFYKAVKHLH